MPLQKLRRKKQDKLVHEVLLDPDADVSSSDDNCSVEENDDDEFLLVEEMKDFSKQYSSFFYGNSQFVNSLKKIVSDKL